MKQETQNMKFFRCCGYYRRMYRYPINRSIAVRKKKIKEFKMRQNYLQQEKEQNMENLKKKHFLLLLKKLRPYLSEFIKILKIIFENFS